MSRYENVHFRAWLLKHPKMKKENKKKSPSNLRILNNQFRRRKKCPLDVFKA